MACRVKGGGGGGFILRRAPKQDCVAPPEAFGLPRLRSGEANGQRSGRATVAPVQTQFETSSTGKPPVLPTPSTRRMLRWRIEIMICVSLSRSEIASVLSRCTSRSTWITVPRANLSLEPRPY